MIFGTFNAFNEFAKNAKEAKTENQTREQSDKPDESIKREVKNSNGDREFNLVTTINVVLPETTDVQVYNAIFRSIRENLLN